MTFASRTQFHVERPWGQRPCPNSVLNVKAVVAAFNQEKAQVGAFSVITNLRMDLFETLINQEKLSKYFRAVDGIFSAAPTFRAKRC